MSQVSRNLRTVAIVVVALVIVGVIALWVSIRPVSAPPAAQQGPTGNPVAEVADNQLPAVFPPNIPMESGAAVTSNFNSAGVNGQVQATRSFQSAKSVDANFSLYQQFLAGAPGTWTIISQVNNPSNPNSKSIFAKDSAGLMTVSITTLPSQPFVASLVTITFITNPVSVPVAATASSTQ